MEISFYSYISLKIPDIESSEMKNLEKLEKYYKKRWIDHINPEELSINPLSITTNNAAEIYHPRLKTIIKTHRSRIWNTIEDMDSDIGRLC